MKYVIGEIVQLTILDHCKGSGHLGKPPQYEVFGRILDVGNKHITIASWLDTDGQVDENTEGYTILKAAIEKMRRLK